MVCDRDLVERYPCRIFRVTASLEFTYRGDFRARTLCEMVF